MMSTEQALYANSEKYRVSSDAKGGLHNLMILPVRISFSSDLKKLSCLISALSSTRIMMNCICCRRSVFHATCYYWRVYKSRRRRVTPTHPCFAALTLRSKRPSTSSKPTARPIFDCTHTMLARAHWHTCIHARMHSLTHPRYVGARALRLIKPLQARVTALVSGGRRNGEGARFCLSFTKARLSSLISIPRAAACSSPKSTTL
jgi:hypothetical protein